MRKIPSSVWVDDFDRIFWDRKSIDWTGPGKLEFWTLWRPKLTPEQIIRITSESSWDVIDLSEAEMLEKDFCSALSSMVIWQDEACREVALYLSEWIHNPYKEIWTLGVLFFAGPTGVWKTELVRALSQVTLWDNKSYIEIRWEELQDKSFWLSKLLWAWDGYVGFWKKWPFHEVWESYKSAKKLRKLHPSLKQLENFSIVLIDEIEKAHPAVHQALLWAMEEWRIKITTNKSKSPWDNKYETSYADLSNTLFIFTSNIGQQKHKKKEIWFIKDSEESKKMEASQILDTALKDMFSPEFLGRVSKVIEFNKLWKEECFEIVDVVLGKLNNHLKDYYIETNYHVALSEGVKEEIMKEWFNPEKWARALKWNFKRLITSKLWKLLSTSEFKEKYDSSINPVIISFDNSNDPKDFEITIHNPQLVDEELVRLSESHQPAEEIEVKEITLNQVTRVLEGVDKISSMMDDFKDDGFSHSELDVLEALDSTFISVTVLEIRDDLQDIRSETSKIAQLYSKFDGKFMRKTSWNADSSIHPRTIRKMIESSAELLYSNENYSEWLFILKLIAQAFLQTKNILWKESFSNEESEFLVTLAVIEANRVWK